MTAAIKVFYARNCEREAMKDAVEMAVLSTVSLLFEIVCMRMHAWPCMGPHGAAWGRMGPHEPALAARMPTFNESSHPLEPTQRKCCRALSTPHAIKCHIKTASQSVSQSTRTNTPAPPPHAQVRHPNIVSVYACLTDMVELGGEPR